MEICLKGGVSPAFLVGLCLSVLSCAGPNVDQGLGRDSNKRHSYHILTARELSEGPHERLTDAIMYTRPGWLAPHLRSGRYPMVVYIGGSRFAEDLSALDSVPTEAVAHITYLRPADHQFEYGPRYGGSVALVVTLKVEIPH